MSDLCLANLPVEILENICEFLDFKDIKNLSLISSQFDEIIGSSNALMNRFKITWNYQRTKEDDDALINSNRKYRKIDISQISPNLLNFFKRSSSLTEVTLSVHELKSSELQLLMESFSKTIVKLDIDSSSINWDVQVYPLEFERLEDLRFTGDFISIFYKAQNVKKLKYIGSNDTILFFSRFLATMDNLKSLSLCGGICLYPFSESVFTSKFLLEDLKLEGRPSLFKNEPENNFAKFIDTQGFSLKKLELNYMGITSQTLQSILKLSSLTHLEFSHDQFFPTAERNESAYQKNSSIKYINFSKGENEMIFCDFIMKCVGLREFDYHAKPINSDLLYILGNQMENLRKLKLSYSIFTPLNMPNIKEMDLLCYGNKDDIVQMIRLNPQLEKLKLPRMLNNEIANIIAEMNVETEFTH